ncbi:MAG: hypothetical protein LUQ59_05480 [Methanothrix sp.]|nr:hypothetical protein [Methanothrix sp.]
MNSEGLKRRLEALRERRARIDAEIEQLEAQIMAQDLAEKRGAEVQVVEPAGRGGSYVLQKQSLLEVIYGPEKQCGLAG